MKQTRKNDAVVNTDLCTTTEPLKFQEKVRRLNFKISINFLSTTSNIAGLLT